VADTVTELLSTEPEIVVEGTDEGVAPEWTDWS